jgi:hypothetical protein
MTPALSHQKNPLIGRDITASAKVDKDEKITRAQILVNDSSEYDDRSAPEQLAEAASSERRISRRQYGAVSHHQRHRRRHRG